MVPPLPFKQIIREGSIDPAAKRILEGAPLAHADAVLSAYDLLQKLHDAGMLDVLRGAVGARDALLEQLAGVASVPETVQALRNLITLGKALGSIDPGFLKTSIEAVSGQTTQNLSGEPPPFWELIKRARSKDARRGMAVAINILEALGRVAAAGRGAQGAGSVEPESGGR